MRGVILLTMIFMADVGNVCAQTMSGQRLFLPGDAGIIEKNMCFYDVDTLGGTSFDWLKKGKLYSIKIKTTNLSGLFYVDSSCNEFFLSGSLECANAIFEMEGLKRLDSNVVHDISVNFLYPLLGGCGNDLLDDNYYSEYSWAVKKGYRSLSDLSNLKELIGKDGRPGSISVHSDVLTGQWRVSLFLLTWNGIVEQLEFSGRNSDVEFTIDKLSRKVLNLKVKRLDFIGGDEK